MTTGTPKYAMVFIGKELLQGKDLEFTSQYQFPVIELSFQPWNTQNSKRLNEIQTQSLTVCTYICCSRPK